YRFVGWNDGYNLPQRQDKGVGSNRTYTAQFEPMAEDTVVLSYTATEGGRIDGNPRQTLAKGQDGEVVTAVANTGWHFVGWSDGNAEARRQDTGVQADLQVTASFEKDAPTPPVPPTPPIQPTQPNPPNPTEVTTESPLIIISRSGSVLDMGMAGRQQKNPSSGNEGANNPGEKIQQNTNTQSGEASEDTKDMANAIKSCKLHWILLGIILLTLLLTELNLRRWRKEKAALTKVIEHEEEDNV
ncbi:MAG: hypothetical protein RR614_06945, partial [Eubacterium sp.]